MTRAAPARPSRNQLELFDGEPFLVELPGRRSYTEPRVTGEADKIGFWLDPTPTYFLVAAAMAR